MELEKAAAWLKEHFNSPAAEDIDVSWYSEVVSDAIAKEQEAEKLFRPVIKGLMTLSTESEGALDVDVRRLLRDGIDVLEGWLTYFHRLHEMLERQLGSATQHPRECCARNRFRAKLITQP